MNPARSKAVALLLCVLTPASLAPAQEMSIEPVRPKAFVAVRPYMSADVPPLRSPSQTRLKELVRAGNLYLTLQDAIALALENNIDIEVSRYDKPLSEWRLERSQAGGALPGVPSGTSQVGSVASGQGVSGSQQAAGVSIPRVSGSRQSGNATISQIGPVTQTLDPIVQVSAVFSHVTNPQPNLVQSLTPVLQMDTRVWNASVQQGLITGGSVTLSYRQNYLYENSPSDVLNPSVATNLSLSFQHNFLQGFGIAVNSRTITVSRMNFENADIGFKSRVVGVIAQVQNAYYSLAAAHEDLTAKRRTAEVAATFVDNVRQQVDIGSIAPTDLIAATSQDVTSKQAVVDAETTLTQRENSLKNLISRDGIADPLLRGVHIVTVDPISIPEKDDLPPYEQMVKEALATRTDLAQAELMIKESEVNNLGTKNGILPSAGVLAGTSQAGLAGDPNLLNPLTEPDPYFVGGLGTAVGQTFRRNFPTNNIAGYYAETIRNRQAQADYGIDQLQLRQNQLSYRRQRSQVEVDVMNYVIALQQARARYDAAVRNRVLQDQLLQAEQSKFSLGASTPYDVVKQQRDLATSRATEVSSLIAYNTARVSLDQTLGRTLEATHVTLAEARAGFVNKPPAATEKQ
jgi:outer membrane protein